MLIPISIYDKSFVSALPVRKQMEVRFLLQRHARARRHCEITIAAVRVSGIVTDDTSFVSAG
jgi:hypothetical protein